MQRLAFSTNAFKQQTLSQAIDAIADAGYAGVELMADVPHAHPASFDIASRAALRDLLRSRNLLVSNINAFTHFANGDTYRPTWITDYPEARNVRIQHTIGAIELAAEFGSRTISLQPGGPLIGTSLDRTTASERFARGLEKVLPTARTHGITLAIEPEPGLLIQTAAEYHQFKQGYFTNEPLIRMNCDIGHLFCVGDEPAEIIGAMPQEIAHVHLEDIGEDRVHQHLAPGKGVIDFRSVFESLEKIAFTGWITVELYPYETTAANVAAAALTYLRPFVNPEQ